MTNQTQVNYLILNSLKDIKNEIGKIHAEQKRTASEIHNLSVKLDFLGNQNFFNDSFKEQLKAMKEQVATIAASSFKGAP